jgi:hypothetical protein
MKILLRSVAVLFVAIAALLTYAVINALASAGGARPGVAVAYVIGSIVLVAGAVKLWRIASRPKADAAPQAAA